MQGPTGHETQSCTLVSLFINPTLFYSVAYTFPTIMLLFCLRGVPNVQRFPSGEQWRFNNPSHRFRRLLPLFRTQARIYAANLINFLRGTTDERIKCSGCFKNETSLSRVSFYDLHSGALWRKINCANQDAPFDSFSRIHLVINRLRLVENQKVSINVGSVI